ncbi:MAG: hypothetical protein ACTS8P_02815 [Arsenophonus sp. NC-XBC3-MAG3]
MTEEDHIKTEGVLIITAETIIIIDTIILITIIIIVIIIGEIIQEVGVRRTNDRPIIIIGKITGIAVMQTKQRIGTIRKLEEKAM